MHGRGKTIWPDGKIYEGVLKYINIINLLTKVI